MKAICQFHVNFLLSCIKWDPGEYFSRPFLSESRKWSQNITGQQNQIFSYFIIFCIFYFVAISKVILLT